MLSPCLPLTSLHLDTGRMLPRERGRGGGFLWNVPDLCQITCIVITTPPCLYRLASDHVTYNRKWRLATGALHAGYRSRLVYDDRERGVTALQYDRTYIAGDKLIN